MSPIEWLEEHLGVTDDPDIVSLCRTLRDDFDLTVDEVLEVVKNSSHRSPKQILMGIRAELNERG